MKQSRLVKRNTAFNRNRARPKRIWRPVTVPLWEKRYCKSVGIHWNKVQETQKSRSWPCKANICNWDDSVCEQEFKNAKARFRLAELVRDGLPTHDYKNIPDLPDQDMNIDEINWNAEIDPELLLGLDRRQRNFSDDDDDDENDNANDDGNDDNIERSENPWFSGDNPPFFARIDPHATSGGWGSEFADEDGDPNRKQLPIIVPTGWGNEFEGEGEDPNMMPINIVPTGWGTEFEDEDNDSIRWPPMIVPATGWGSEFEVDEDDDPNRWPPMIVPTGWGSEFEDEDNDPNRWPPIIVPTGWGSEFEDEDSDPNW